MHAFLVLFWHPPAQIVRREQFVSRISPEEFFCHVDAGRKTQDSRHKTQDARHKAQDTRLKTQDTRLKTQDSRHKTQDS